MTESKDKAQEQAQFAASVKASLNTARQKTSAINRIDTGLFAVNVISPAAASLLAAVASIIGGNTIFPPAAVIVEDGGWRLACILVAIFSFIATIGSAFKKIFEDRLTRGNQCVGRLLTLDLAMSTGNKSRQDAAWEYGEIIKNYPDFVS